MKNILVFAAIAGAAIAVTVVYLQNKASQNGKVINVEDGFAVNA